MQVAVRKNRYSVDKDIKVRIYRIHIYIISKTFDSKVVKLFNYQMTSANTSSIAATLYELKLCMISHSTKKE